MIKHFIKNLIRRTGLELHRYTPHNSQHCATQAMLNSLGIDVVFDVGANAGQYGEELFASNFKGRVISFEPLSIAHAKLAHRAESNPNWVVHPRTALGADTGQILINVSANSVSSSILPMLQSHIEAAPESTYTSTEAVPLIRLDDVARQYANNARAMLLKIDTQGFEWQVLDGAPALLKRVSAVQLELSLVPMYQGQRLWRDYVDRLERESFQLYFAYPAFTNSTNGQTLQWDAMFVRR